MPSLKSTKLPFFVLLGGQSISLLGTGMSRFALMIWAYQVDGSATTLALLGFFVCITSVIACPFAGVLVDRWDRRKVMALADAGAGLMTLGMLALFMSGNLQLWHLYVMEGLAGIFEAFQEPAFSASISVLVPRESYTRANAMFGLGRSAARILAPALAGMILPLWGLQTVMMIDLGTMSLAVLGLLAIRIPTPEITETGRQAVSKSFWSELQFGMGYIWKNAGLRGLMATYFMVNLLGTITYFAVHAPMILTRTGGDETALGIVRTVMGVGGVAGGLIISIWGGPRRKARVYLLATGWSFLIADMLTALSKSTPGWALAGFIAEISIPFIVSPYFALWQEIVPPDVQGRVFSAREMVQIGAQPLGYLLGGFLADHVFEPALMPAGALASTLGRLVGTTPGAGMSAMFICTSLLGFMILVFGWLSPAIRKLDEHGG